MKVIEINNVNHDDTLKLPSISESILELSKINSEVTITVKGGLLSIQVKENGSESKIERVGFVPKTKEGMEANLANNLRALVFLANCPHLKIQ